MSSRQIGLAVVFFALVGIALFVVGYLNAPGDLRPSLASELAKGGVNLAFVSAGGAIIAALVRAMDVNREKRRRLLEYLLQTLAETVAAYNGVKASRRRLRASGLTYVAMGAMNEEQEKSFLAEMGSLNDLQLSLEALKRRTAARKDVFGWGVEEALGRLEHVVGEAIKYWEERRSPESDPALRKKVNEAWMKLTLFVGSADIGFVHASNAMSDIEEFIAERLRRV